MENVSITQVESLLSAIKDKSYHEASKIIDEIVQARNEGILKQVEELSKNLHKTLEEFGSDTALLKHTKHDLPDASERLQYVINATEEASNKTLSSSENIVAILETMSTSIQDESLLELISQAQTEVTEIMMAQSFQDLTGQVLNRIVILVTSLEQSLNELIEKSGVNLGDLNILTESDDEKRKAEMKGIGPNVTKSSQLDSVSSQNDVDDLLGDLGI